MGIFFREGRAESRVPFPCHLDAGRRVRRPAVLVARHLDGIVSILHPWLVAVRVEYESWQIELTSSHHRRTRFVSCLTASDTLWISCHRSGRLRPCCRGRSPGSLA